MNSTPFLTIGIASYNYGKYLDRAFASIQKQKFTDFEVLYCDDGSTDDSIEIIEEIIRAHPDMIIRLVKGDNKGILANKNRIIEHARGKYLLICDADDYMSDDCLEKLCMTAKIEGADCVIGGFGEVDAKGNIYKAHIPSRDANPWIYIWHHAQIYETDMLKKYNIKFDGIPDDVCYIQRIHQYARKISFVPENLYNWVRHADSASRDIQLNPDWHPNYIWKNIVNCMAKIQTNQTDTEKKWQIRYFIYKWFYLNMADEPVNDKRKLKRNIKELQADMRRICPEYRKLSILTRVLKEKDTLFAKAAILACWLAEGTGIISLLPIIRTEQQRRR